MVDKEKLARYEALKAEMDALLEDTDLALHVRGFRRKTEAEKLIDSYELAQVMKGFRP